MAKQLFDRGLARARAGFTDFMVSTDEGRQYGVGTRQQAIRLATSLVEAGRGGATITQGSRELIRHQVERGLDGVLHQADYLNGTVDGIPGGVLLAFGDPLQPTIGFLAAADRASGLEVLKTVMTEHPDYVCGWSTEVKAGDGNGGSSFDLVHFKDGRMVVSDMAAKRAANVQAAAERQRQREAGDGGLA